MFNYLGGKSSLYFNKLTLETEYSIAFKLNIHVFNYIGCLKNRFTMVFQMLPCGECYENRRTNYPPFKVFNNGYFVRL
jgi:hypothetical protein